MIPSSDRILTLLLSLILFWAPLPWGSVIRPAELGLRLAAFAALALAVWTPRPSALRRVGLPAAAVAGLALLGLLQSLPWPHSLVRLVSPRHLELHLAAAALTEGGAGLPSLSLAPAVSRSAALSWAASAAILAAAAVAGRRARRRRWLGAALLAAGMVQILYGVRTWAAGGSPRLRGTFVNPDHLALYLEMLLAVAFAAAWWGWRRARMESSLENRVVAVGVPAAVWLVLFAGLAFTGSRAGLAAALLAAGFQVYLLALARGKWRAGALAAGGLIAGAAALALLVFSRGTGRWLATSAYDLLWSQRIKVWGLSLDLWRDYPWTGTGLGTFREAFPMVQPAEMSGWVWGRAHNDLLELGVTGGLVALLIAGIGIWALGLRLWQVLKRGERSEDRAAALAALGALGAAGLHELLDFGLTLPVNGISLAALAGAAVAARMRSRPDDPGAGPRPGSRNARSAGGPPAGGGPR